MLDLSSLKGDREDGVVEKVYDVLIIGGGPAGATAALYAARSGLSTAVLDKSVAAGALAVTSKIANYPGIPRVVTGLELLQIIRDQAISFGAEFVTTQVVSTGVFGDVKLLQTPSGPYKGKVVIIATGKMGRKSKIPGEEQFLGRGVSYCATCDAAFFKGQVVAVVGSSREAVEEALFISRLARKLYLIAPGEKFHAEGELLAELEANPGVEIRRNQGLREVMGEDAVTGIKLSTPTGEETLTADGVFIYLPGNLPITDFLEGAVEVNEQQCIQVDRERATSVPGVYAVGDVICSYIQQAVVAAADGAIAAMAAEKYIHGRSKVRSDWA